MRQIVDVSKKEKGQSLVELGVVLVVVLIILAGVVDLGGIMFQVLAMRDAAQEGAAYTSIYPTACNQTIARVRESLHNPDTEYVDVIVTVNGVSCESATAADACASKEVNVQVKQVNYALSMPFIGAFIGKQTIDLDTNVSSTIIRPPCP
jgi:Flp pilus assembly protein TadG